MKSKRRAAGLRAKPSSGESGSAKTSHPGQPGSLERQALQQGFRSVAFCRCGNAARTLRTAGCIRISGPYRLIRGQVAAGAADNLAFGIGIFGPAGAQARTGRDPSPQCRAGRARTPAPAAVADGQSGTRSLSYSVPTTCARRCQRSSASVACWRRTSVAGGMPGREENITRPHPRRGGARGELTLTRCVPGAGCPKTACAWTTLT